MGSSLNATAILLATLVVGTCTVACSASDSGAAQSAAGPADEQSSSSLASEQRAWEIVSAFKLDNLDSSKPLTDESATRLYLQAMCDVEHEIGSYAGFDHEDVDYNDFRGALQRESYHALKAIHDTDYTREFIRDTSRDVEGGKSYCQLAGS